MVFSTSHSAGDVNVCVIEIEEGSDLLSLVPIVTNAVLEEHHVVLHVIVFSAPKSIPRNSRSQKLRIVVMNRFLKGQFDAHYVAYNV